MKRFFLFIILIFIGLTSKSQKFELYYDFNFGLPFCTGLREFQSSLAEQVPLKNFKTQDNFYYYYGFTIGARISNKLSFYFNNKVTGAKSSVADYSGHFRITNELRGYTYGVKYEFYKIYLSKGNVRFCAKGFVTNSKLILKTDAALFYNSSSDEVEFKSLDFGMGAGVCYEYPLKFLILRAYLDLDIVFGGKIKFKENSSGKDYLVDNNGNKITTGWSGIGTGLGISFPLSK